MACKTEPNFVAVVIHDKSSYMICVYMCIYVCVYTQTMSPIHYTSRSTMLCNAGKVMMVHHIAQSPMRIHAAIVIIQTTRRRYRNVPYNTVNMRRVSI